MSTALQTLTSKLAARLDMGNDGSSLVETLKATAFKGQVSDAQMTALMVVANQYALNPWTKEIYAFPDKQNGIVPVVGVDGWARIINNNDKFDGMEFVQDDASCTCIIYRKDRQHPIKVTEYMDECKRGTGPWQSHPRRMLRHKAMIQCARIAFGFGGIYDQDEAERIVEKDMGAAIVESTPRQRETWTAEAFEAILPKLLSGIQKGKSIEDALAWLRAKADLTDGQEAVLRASVSAATPTDVNPATGEIIIPAAEIEARLRSAKDLDTLYLAADLINTLPEAEAERLGEVFSQCEAKLNGAA